MFAIKETKMKIFLLILVFSARTWASGCDFYHYERHVESKWVSELPWSDYEIVARTDRQAIIKLTNGETYNLSWIKTEKHAAPHTYPGVQKFDLSFYEDNGCGPAFECISGQIIYTHTDDHTGLLIVTVDGNGTSTNTNTNIITRPVTLVMAVVTDTRPPASI